MLPLVVYICGQGLKRSSSGLTKVRCLIKKNKLKFQMMTRTNNFISMLSRRLLLQTFHQYYFGQFICDSFTPSAFFLSPYQTFFRYFLVCPIWLLEFFLFFYNEPDLGAGIDPGMALTTFPSSMLDKTRFEPTTFRSCVKFPNHQTGLTPFKLHQTLCAVKIDSGASCMAKIHFHSILSTCFANYLNQRSQTRGPREGLMQPANIRKNEDLKRNIEPIGLFL